MEAWRLAAELAETQHGILALHHFDLLGIDEDARKRLLAAGLLAHARYGVYRVTGAPPSWKGDVLAACWAGGTRAAASHLSAAALWPLPGGDESIQEITCPRWRRAHCDGLVVHESLALPDDDITIVDGIPVTTVERTLFDLGAVCSRNLVERALEAALRDELTTLDKVTTTFARLARRGRRGVAILRSILDEYDADRKLTESDREKMMLQVFRKHGLPDPIPQFVVRHNGLSIARVDAALPQYKLAFEYESYQWHTGKSALVRDNRRRNQLLAIGWPTIGVTAADLRSGGELVCSQIFAVIRRVS
jgi:predicted transcriptional regulator of viral defense system